MSNGSSLDKISVASFITNTGQETMKKTFLNLLLLKLMLDVEDRSIVSSAIVICVLRLVQTSIICMRKCSKLENSLTASVLHVH